MRCKKIENCKVKLEYWNLHPTELLKVEWLLAKMLAIKNARDHFASKIRADLDHGASKMRADHWSPSRSARAMLAINVHMILSPTVYITCRVFSYLESTYRSDIHSKTNLISIFLCGVISVQTGEFLLPVLKWPHKRKNGSKFRCDVITEVIIWVFNHWRKIWHSLQLLFIIWRVGKHKTRYFSSNWRFRVWILVICISHYPTWTHSSFRMVILNPEVKFCLFEC